MFEPISAALAWISYTTDFRCSNQINSSKVNYGHNYGGILPMGTSTAGFLWSYFFLVILLSFFRHYTRCSAFRPRDYVVLCLIVLSSSLITILRYSNIKATCLAMSSLNIMWFNSFFSIWFFVSKQIPIRWKRYSQLVFLWSIQNT